MASQNPETKFIQSIHRHLHHSYAEKNSNPWRSGTPDVWYSGNKGDLWVEYKYVEELPRSVAIFPNLTAQQSRWLNNRYDEGRNVAVILGTPDGGVIYRDKDWGQPFSLPELIELMKSRADIARWIFDEVGTCQDKSL